MGNRRAIPDRWLDYTPIGKQIKGTRFIAFKCPLREDVVAEVPSENRLSCGSLLNKIPNLGMIIDLTFTTRYYDPKFFEKRGLVYKKIMIPGKEIPPKRFVNNFADTVNNFLQANIDNDKLIGVHCTHGVNRTGYLISNYMISELKSSPQEAMQNVGEARGHPIERENYRDHLISLPTTNQSNNDDNDFDLNHDLHSGYNNNYRSNSHNNANHLISIYKRHPSSTENWRTDCHDNSAYEQTRAYHNKYPTRSRRYSHDRYPYDRIEQPRYPYRTGDVQNNRHMNYNDVRQSFRRGTPYDRPEGYVRQSNSLYRNSNRNERQSNESRNGYNRYDSRNGDNGNINFRRI